MANRILELEAEITEQAGRTGRARSRSRPPATGMSALKRARAQGQQQIRRTRRAAKAAPKRVARSLGAVSYTVPGIVPLVAQPTNMTCWAASYTMLENWSQNRSVAIETALADVGAEWVTKFQNNQGLSGKDVTRFMAATGLIAEPAASYPVEQWEQMLRDFGPLLIVTDEAPGKRWAVHARVIYGIHGDGTAAGTKLKIHNPAPVGTGRTLEEKVSTFLPKYEQMAQLNGFLGLQIIHWPPDQQLSVTRSLKAGSAMRAGRRAAALSAGISANTLAERLGGDMPQRVQELIAGGISDQAIAEFLLQLVPGEGDAAAAQAASVRRARALSLVNLREGTTLTLPTGHVLEGWQAQLLLNAIFVPLTVLLKFNPAMMFRAFQDIANIANVTIGIGPAAGATGAEGIGIGIGLGAGLLVAPGDRIGFYGSLEHVYGGFAASASLTLQITAVKGGPSNFSGRAVTIGGSGGEGYVAGGRLLLDSRGDSVIGVMVEAGVGAGLLPGELTGSLQDTVTSLSYRGVRAFTIDAASPAVTAAAEFGTEAAEVARRLLQEGVPEDEITAFLQTLQPEAAAAKGLGYVRALGDGDEFEVHLPGSTVLSGWKAELFLAALAGIAAVSTAGVGFLPLYGMMQGMRALANRLGVTIAVGPAISGGLGAGGSFGTGVLFAPGDRLGFYGTAAFLNGALASISATAQITVVHGGPELLDGSAVAVGITGSAPIPVSPTGGLYALMSDGQFIGVTAEVGVDIGLAPLEVLASFQYSGQSVDAQSLARQQSMSSLWARSAAARRTRPAHAQSRAMSRTGLARQLTSLPDLSAWQELIRFFPPADITNTLRSKMTGIAVWDGWPVQRFDRAHGPINLDYYPVKVTQMPSADGQQLSPEAMLERMRLGLNDIVDNRFANFEPYDDEEAAIWTSSNPEKAVIHIDMRMGGAWANPDDGSVACTRSRPDHWIFSTIWTIGDIFHPVSGNRQFGFVPGDDGSVIFYTRGADRPTQLHDSWVQDTIFSGAHSLWMSFQQGLKAWVDGNGGAAEIVTATSERYDWDAVKSTYG